MIAIHIRKNSPKRPNAKFSIYAQSFRQGISWKIGWSRGVLMRYRFIRVNEPKPENTVWDYEIRWIRYLVDYRKATRRPPTKQAKIASTM